MKSQEIKFRDKSNNYSVIIGHSIIDQLPKKIKILFPKTKKIVIIIDKNVHL